MKKNMDMMITMTVIGKLSKLFYFHFLIAIRSDLVYDKKNKFSEGGTPVNYAEIKRYDTANGSGVRVSLFVSGCTHHCKGCFNSAAWDFSYGIPFTQETINTILEYCKPDYIAGLSLLGGEPFEYENQIALLPLVKKFKEIYPQKTIWCWSGYLFDHDILKTMLPKWPETKQLLSFLDILVDGAFVEELKNISLAFRGSSNQRIILVQESLKANKILLWSLSE